MGFADLPLAYEDLEGDVAKDHDGSPVLPVHEDGVAGVSHREAGAIFPPEDLVFAMMADAVLESLVDRAEVSIVGRSVAMRMMDEAVLGASLHVFSGPACYLFCYRVGEGDHAFCVKAVDAVAG